MRGLLGFLVVAALAVGLVAVAATYVALPAIVSAAVQGAVRADGQAVSVRVSTSLQGVLLHGRVDAIVIEGRNVRLGSTSAETVTATLADVSIADRSFSAIDGTLSGVELALADGETLRIDRVDLSGPSTAIVAVGQVSAKALEAAIAEQLKSQGIGRDQVSVTNGEIRLVVEGRTVLASVSVEGSALILSTQSPLGSVPILRPPADGSWRLVDVSLTSAGADFTLDIRASAVTGLG
jgi:hypothetical protein